MKKKDKCLANNNHNFLKISEHTTKNSDDETVVVIALGCTGCGECFSYNFNVDKTAKAA